MAAAFALPRVLEKYADRAVMLAGAAMMVAPLLLTALALWQMQSGAWSAILVSWPILAQDTRWW